jgi:hypothetical protein
VSAVSLDVLSYHDSGDINVHADLVSRWRDCFRLRSLRRVGGDDEQTCLKHSNNHHSRKAIYPVAVEREVKWFDKCNRVGRPSPKACGT